MKKCSNCNIILSPKDEICPKCGFKILTEIQPENEKPKPLFKKIIEHPKSLKIAFYALVVVIFLVVVWWIVRSMESQYEYYKWQDKKTENRR